MQSRIELTWVCTRSKLMYCHPHLPERLQAFPDAGSIVRSAGAGAGFVFKTSAIPLAIFTLNQCSAVAPHIHPNAAETLFVLEGRCLVFDFVLM